MSMKNLIINILEAAAFLLLGLGVSAWMSSYKCKIKRLEHVNDGLQIHSERLTG